jgi:hypothetical protein
MRVSIPHICSGGAESEGAQGEEEGGGSHFGGSYRCFVPYSRALGKMLSCGRYEIDKKTKERISTYAELI